MPLFVSQNITRTSEDAETQPIRRRSTTISMMEEEFGMRTPPQAVGRFGEQYTRTFHYDSPGLTVILKVYLQNSGFSLRSAGTLPRPQNLVEVLSWRGPGRPCGIVTRRART